MKIRRIIIILIMILILTGCGKTNTLFDSKKEVTVDSENQEVQEIVENVYQYLIDKNYLSEPNLDTFEITKLTKKGYYKSNGNIVYIKMDCNYTCKDETDSCILNNAPTDQKSLWLYKNNDDEGHYFYLEYDLKKDKVLGKKGTYGPDSDFATIVE